MTNGPKFHPFLATSWQMGPLPIGFGNASAQQRATNFYREEDPCEWDFGDPRSLKSIESWNHNRFFHFPCTRVYRDMTGNGQSYFLFKKALRVNAILNKNYVKDLSWINREKLPHIYEANSILSAKCYFSATIV